MTRDALSELRAPDAAFDRGVGERLEEIERALEAAVSSDIRLVSEAARHLISAGGKRFRPRLVVLGSYFGEPEVPAVVDGAVAIELTHLASLYHDDVIDEADHRRGTPSVNATWGNTIAVLTGDYLFAKASEISADLGISISRLFAETIARVCEGQILEAEVTGRLDATEEAYTEVIRRKTAALIATSCRLGGLLSGAAPADVERLDRCGEALGMAFQLSDDIMDLTADEATLGKEPGVDLKEGIFTLPVLYALDAAGGELRGLLAAGPLDGDRLRRALDLVRSDGALDRAREAVTGQVGLAVAEAEQLAGGPARDALLALARFLATRCGAAA